MTLKYESSDKSFPAFEEEISIDYMVFEDQFFVIETTNSVVLGKYHKVWIMKPLVHRPQNLAVTYVSQVSYNYHRTKNNCQSIIKSVAALKNLVQTLEPTEDPLDEQMAKSIVSYLHGTKIGSLHNSHYPAWGFDDFQTVQGKSQFTNYPDFEDFKNTQALINTVVTRNNNESVCRDDAINLIQEDMPEEDDQTIEADSSDEDTRRESIQEEEQTYEEDYTVPEFLWDWECVTDWKRRISKYTDQQKRFYTDMVPRFQEIRNVIESPSDNGWAVLAAD